MNAIKYKIVDEITSNETMIVYSDGGSRGNPGPSAAGFVIINAINDTYTGTPIVISCEEYNSAVLLDTPDDIVYLYRLAQESPLLYAELACNPVDYRNMWML